MAVKKAVKKKVAAKKIPPVIKVVRPSLSGEEIEKQLALAHKMLAKASFNITMMLARRRLSPKLIEESAAQTRAASDHMERLVALLKEKT